MTQATQEDLDDHKKFLADIEHVRAQTEQIRTQIDQSLAETAKIRRETYWYPMVVSAGLVAGIIALTKLFL